MLRGILNLSFVRNLILNRSNKFQSSTTAAAVDLSERAVEPHIILSGESFFLYVR